MTVKITFTGDLATHTIISSVFPETGGLGFSISDKSDNFNRHDLNMVIQDGSVVVKLEGFNISNLSDETLTNIIETVPLRHTDTQDA